MIIQIYEVQTPAEAAEMIRLGVAHVGSVILSAAECRNPVIKATIEIVQAAGCKSSLIPLFNDSETIALALDYYRPDIVHFCETLPMGDFDSRAFCCLFQRQADVRRMFPDIEIMRTIPIGAPGVGEIVPSLEWAALFEPLSDWFLTDTLIVQNNVQNDQAQPVNGFVGITGRTCDWSIARALVLQSRIPVILAGGIGPHNVSAGIMKVEPAGVDSCTQTNANDADGRGIRFQKDPEKVKALVSAAREAAGGLDPGDKLLKKTYHSMKN